VLGICQRFHCLPSALADEDASLLRLLKIEALGRREEGEPDAGQ
jgi:hypothetical protein